MPNKFIILKINNSKKASVKSGKWKDPGAKLYDQLLNAMYSPSNKVDDPGAIHTPGYLKEAYLVAPVNKIKYGPYGQTPYSRSGCEYPHHVIRNGELVVHIDGLKKAYEKAWRQEILKDEVKKHLQRHMNEFGLKIELHHGQIYWNERADSITKIEENFCYMKSYVAEYNSEFRKALELDKYCEQEFVTESTAVDGIDISSVREKIDGDLLWIENFANNPNVSNDDIYPLKRGDVTSSYFVKWFFQTEEFSNDDPGEFNFDVLIHNPNIKNYVYGYYLNNLEGVIRVQHRKDEDYYAISMLFVNGKFQGSGIGQTLLKFVIDRFGDKELRLNVFESNRRAIHIYKKYGFEIIKVGIVEEEPGENDKFVGQKFYEMRRSINYDLPTKLNNESYTVGTLPDLMYFASSFKIPELKGRVFLTPYIGIASIFLINRHHIMKDYIIKHHGSTPRGTNYNLGYKEWFLPDAQLNKPLDQVNIMHNISKFKEVESGQSSGYIYVIDISKIKNQLSLFKDKTPNREVIYQGDEPLNVVKIIPHNVKWELKFDPEEAQLSGEGFVEGVGSMDDLDWIEKFITEEGQNPNVPPVQETAPPPEGKKESLPKQTDKQESDKNGVRRKNLYIAFIEWCKSYNPKNTFGSVFDKDAFHSTYPFVPEEMRYFYRLANPMLCVLAGELTFFAVAELRKLNIKNPRLNEMMIFAATKEDVRVFNKKDKKVYRGVEENGILRLAETLGNTFDIYIQKMINKGDILNAPLEENNIV